MTTLFTLLVQLCTIWLGANGPIYHVRIRQLGGERHLRRVEANVQTAADLSGVPASVLAVVAHAESGLDPQAVSRTGARGPMQLQPGTEHFKEWRRVCALQPDDCNASNYLIGARHLFECWKICGGGYEMAYGRYRGAGCRASARDRKLMRMAKGGAL